MTGLDRRSFNRLLAMAAVGVTAGVVKAPAVLASGKKAGRVVIVGGGAGGASTASFLKKGAPELQVTLIEPKTSYTTCFFSNHYIGGFRSLPSLQFDYAGIKALGVNIVNDHAVGVDAERKQVFLAAGQAVPYDKLVLSPGIEIRYEAIEGYSPEVANLMPHAYLAGDQTQLLRRRLLDMEDGGTVVMSIAANPIRCPSAPYERASLIAHYLRYFKPASKLVILDGKSAFDRMELFEAIWKSEYKDIVEWLPVEKHGGVVKVLANEMSLVTASGETIKADVVNLIPPQRAAGIVAKAGCNAGDWCPIVPDSFASRQVKDVFVLGDAANARKMPKTASSAHSQAQTVANVITTQLTGRKMFPPRYRHTCWSLLSTNNSIKEGASYTAGEEQVEEQTAFTSDLKDDASVRAANFKESLAWYKEITGDMFAKS
jgi:NADPH-dependent 2,4-dienoyl-CoA reductase/sulfur reductase-like enzyme